MQAIEGALDSAHSWFLHKGTIPGWQARQALSSDTSPRIEVETTNYGMRYAAIRLTNSDGRQYVRTTAYALPYAVFIPRSLERAELGHTIFFVPLDDYNTYLYDVFHAQDGHELDEALMRKDLSAEVGVDLDKRYFRLDWEYNDWNQDRAAMKNGDWTGIRGFENQDVAVQESMGAITDGTKERLGTSDVAIIRMRKLILENVDRSEAGEELIGQNVAVTTSEIRGWQAIIDRSSSWNDELVSKEAGRLDIPLLQ